MSVLGRPRGSETALFLTVVSWLTWAAEDLLLERSMSDSELKALAAQVKKLTARVEARERLLERILRQKPVSERQLERMLRSRGVTHPEIRR